MDVVEDGASLRIVPRTATLGERAVALLRGSAPTNGPNTDELMALMPDDLPDRLVDQTLVDQTL